MPTTSVTEVTLFTSADGGTYTVFGRVFDKNGASTDYQTTVTVRKLGSISGTLFEAFAVKDGVDGSSVEGIADVPYDIPNLNVVLHTVGLPVPPKRFSSVWKRTLPAGTARSMVAMKRMNS